MEGEEMRSFVESSIWVQAGIRVRYQEAAKMLLSVANRRMTPTIGNI